MRIREILMKKTSRCENCNKLITRNAKRCIKCHNETRIISEQHRENTRKSAINNTSYGMRGKKHSESSKKKIRLRRREQIFPMKDTGIEIKIQNFLKEIKIDFIKHQYVEIEHGYQCDILIPLEKIIIECDGDWWHGNPRKYPNPTEYQIKKIELDKIRTEELIGEGFKVIRLWEEDIEKINVKEFRFLVHKTIAQNKEENVSQ